jgi:hypothetical protein
MSGIKTRRKAPASDTAFFAALAEEERLWNDQVSLTDHADTLYFAVLKEKPELKMVEHRKLPDRMGELYRQADAATKKALAASRRLSTKKPHTLAGIIALLEHYLKDGIDDSNLIENALDGLREVAEPAEPH